MIAIISILFASFLAPEVSAAIGGDLNCTVYNGTMFVWTPAAVACQNTISDASCAILYPTTDTLGLPAAGNAAGRPLACYTTATVTPAAVVLDMKTAALASCPKTCGFCCNTDAFNCKNADYPRLNCATITNSQCNSPAWRNIIAADCPSACGFCGQGGCVDAVTNCGNDLSICQNIGMQSFVNTYCQKSCGRCPSTTTSGYNNGGGSCTSYVADSSSNCASWAKNGFCTNNFYTVDQRRARCGSTCRIC
ncbi:ShKT domain-containing protein [Caenorhabditis elegans]|uniref:ShKT domain-containing protein n=1 Tax=Caenorhabditis elegans TaxID=6239 RepID=O16420_CAEEL|nr:ShKT domain-containing protein [Caenorhabditis elegans]CCD70836.1 ShKT domain-containing protein [Caenorhabditis elegans]|eukprot:NP_504148.1 PHAryngeal gland Toxin-related [Caenorhabditis elegans]